MLPAHPFLAYTSALTHLLTFGSKETKPAPWVSGGKTGPSYLIYKCFGRVIIILFRY
jgi:hypothetical protein